MHKSADLPTARTLPMVASLDLVRQYSTILICIAFSKVAALRHTSDCCSDPVSGPTASIDSSAVSVWTHVWLVLQATRRKTKRTKKKKRALEAKVCAAICCLCSFLTTSTAMSSTEAVTCKAACIARTASTHNKQQKQDRMACLSSLCMVLVQDARGKVVPSHKPLTTSFVCAFSARRPQGLRVQNGVRRLCLFHPRPGQGQKRKSRSSRGTGRDSFVFSVFSLLSKCNAYFGDLRDLADEHTLLYSCHM